MSTPYPSLEDLKVDQAMQPRSPAEPASDSRRCQCRQRSQAPHRTRWWRRCPGKAWACCLGRSSSGCARYTCARTSAARRGCGCGPSKAIPAERHHAQGQHRPRRLCHQEGEAHLFGQREFCGPQRAPHQPLRVRGERAERPWAEGQRSHGDSGHSRERHQPGHHPHCDLRAHGCPQPCSTTPWTTPSLTSEGMGEQLSSLTLQQEKESPQGTGCGGLLPGGGAVLRRACSGVGGGVQHWITWACHLYTLASLEPQPLNWAKAGAGPGGSDSLSRFKCWARRQAD
nr:syntenin-2 isoform X1 [Kogia breviceps]